MTCLLYTKQEAMTAADLCEQLFISSGAVTIAIKHLILLRLVERISAPGNRRDH